MVARGAHLAAIREHGIRIVESDIGAFAVRVEASDDLRELAAADLLLLTFKAHQWPAFTEQLTPSARRGVTIVTLQNGVPFWFERTPPLKSVDPGGTIGALFSDAQTIGGVVHVSGHIASPGEIAQSGGLRYLLGEASGQNGARARGLASVLGSAGLEASVDDDLRRALWHKLVGNASLNPVTAARGMTIGELMRDSEALDEVRALMIEALEVGKALGLVRDVEEEARARIAYAARLDDVKTSMLQDVEAGRPLELDPILGAVIELGERHHVAVPKQRAMYERLQRIPLRQVP